MRWKPASRRMASFSGIAMVMAILPGSGTLAGAGRRSARPGQRHRAVRCPAQRCAERPSAARPGIRNRRHAGDGRIRRRHRDHRPAHGGGADIWWEIVHEAAPRGQRLGQRPISSAGAAGSARIRLCARCRGNEPFWSVALKDGRAQFSTPGSDRFPLAGRTLEQCGGASARMALRHSRAERRKRRQGMGEHRARRPILQRSDVGLRLPFDATLITPAGNVLAGCCTRAP